MYEWRINRTECLHILGLLDSTPEKHIEKRKFIFRHCASLQLHESVHVMVLLDCLWPDDCQTGTFQRPCLTSFLFGVRRSCRSLQRARGRVGTWALSISALGFGMGAIPWRHSLEARASASARTRQLAVTSWRVPGLEPMEAVRPVSAQPRGLFRDGHTRPWVHISGKEARSWATHRRGPFPNGNLFASAAQDTGNWHRASSCFTRFRAAEEREQPLDDVPRDPTCRQLCIAPKVHFARVFLSIYGGRLVTSIGHIYRTICQQAS